MKYLQNSYLKPHADFINILNETNTPQQKT